MKKRVGIPYIVWHYLTVEISDEDIERHDGDAKKAAIEAATKTERKPREDISRGLMVMERSECLSLVSESFDELEPEVEDVD